jgi:hypothetical protein
MKKKMSVKEIELRIISLEQKISENIGDLESMKRELIRLKLHEFEEDMREQNHMSRLLKG